MYTILQVSMNLFAIAILLAIIMDIRNQNELRSGKQRHYVRWVYGTIVVLALEAFAWVVDGRTGPVFRWLNTYGNVLYFIGDAVPALLWVIYLNNQLYGDTAQARRLNILLAVPALINLVLSLLTPFNKWMFYIDEANVYHRGERFYLIGMILASYMTYYLVTILLNRKRLNRRTFYTLLFSNIPPILGGVLQGVLYGMPSLWTFTSLVLLFTYFNIQNTRLGADFLTGVSNRRDINSYLNSLIKNSPPDYPFSGIFMDMDELKNINDMHGHMFGDEALRATAEILKKSMRKDDFIARFGGDEFIIIAPKLGSSDELERAVNRIYANLEEYNKRGILPFKLNLSMGYSVYDRASGMSADDYIRQLDEMMYANKRATEA